MKGIELKNLAKSFGDVRALDRINLTLEGNKIYGLLGRNGAGKSTMLNLISNRLFPTDGSILIDGEPALENDRALGKVFCMSEKTLYPETMRVDGGFRMTASFYPGFRIAYANALSRKFGLDTRKKVKSLSTGYLSIFKLILAMACTAPYTLLDEPVLGLDANHRELFYKELLADYSENSRTIVISTHLIEEVADVIEQVVIIKEGTLLLDKPAEKVRGMGYSVSGKAADVDAWCAGKQVLGADTLGGLKSVCLLGKAENIPPELTVTALDLQKLFVQLTNAE